MLVRAYNPATDFEAVMTVIESEGKEWAGYYAPQHRNRYGTALASCSTFVAEIEGTVCGYVRAINDHGFDVFVMDLLVQQAHRGSALGHKLMQAVAQAFPASDVYVLSDVDGYYNKLGFEREGSVFKVK